MAEGGDIIIKKIKKGGHGHHGGAWKVAYADFVTAMMAFFLLLWLLSSTSEEQREGIADYFTPTTGLKDSKGIGFEGGKSPNDPGASKSTLTEAGIVVGQVPQGPLPDDPRPAKEPMKDLSTGDPNSALLDRDKNNIDPGDSGDTGKADDAEFKKVEEQVMNAIEQTPDIKEMKDNIIITHTPEGLKIDMVDDQNKPMFAPGSSLMTDTGRKVLKAVGDIVARSPNKISLAGNTDTAPYSAGVNYTNWELSADRANAARRYLVQGVVEPERVAKVQGMADRDLLVPTEPNSPRNRRISLTLLRNNYMTNSKPANTSRGLLSVPDSGR